MSTKIRRIHFGIQTQQLQILLFILLHFQPITTTIILFISKIAFYRFCQFYENVNLSLISLQYSTQSWKIVVCSSSVQVQTQVDVHVSALHISRFCSLLFFDCYVVLFESYVGGYQPPKSCANAGCSGNHPTRAHVRAMMYLIFLVFMYVRVVRTTFSHHLFFLLHVSPSLNESLDKLDIREYTSTIAFLIVTDDKLTL